MTRPRLIWGVMLALMLVYLAGFLAGWNGLASWHLLLVIAAILLIYNVVSVRGRT